MKKRILSALIAACLMVSALPASVSAYQSHTVSEACIEFIKEHEGFSDTAYAYETGWYIGYGCSVSKADYPEGLTEEEADRLLRENMVMFGDYVNDFLYQYDIDVNQSQFDALASMTFNFGPSWLSTENRLPSYLVSGVANYTDREIVNAFAAWCHMDGEANENLLERRIAEAKMFLYGDYSFEVYDWCWLIMDLDGGTAVSDVACYEKGGVYGSLPTAEKSGTVLSGWQTQTGALLSASDTVTENLRVRAVWGDGSGSGGEEQGSATGNEPEKTEQSHFEDVALGAWYCDYVNDLVARGVIEGYPDGSFKPELSVSWGEALKLILLAAGYKEPEPAEDAHWAAPYLELAVSRGFVERDAVPELDRAITRLEIADLAARALALSCDWSQGNPYSDIENDAVLALYQAGIMEGSVENGQRVYKGADNITRAEISAVIWRIADYVEENIILFFNERLPVDHTLPENPYDSEDFYSENGRVYYGGTDYTARYGIDVSFYQNDIDWQAVADDGIDFAIIRAGYRGCSEGELFEDERFREYVEGALAAGIDVGLYFFSQALTPEEAREEAEYILELARGYNITFPIAFDWEPLNYSYSRTKDYDYSVLTSCAIAFCDTISEAGYAPIVYLNETFAYLRYDMTQLYGRYPIWLAHYTENTDYVYDFQIWQYGSSGSVAGIGGRVDMDIAFF